MGGERAFPVFDLCLLSLANAKRANQEGNAGTSTGEPKVFDCVADGSDNPGLLLSMLPSLSKEEVLAVNSKGHNLLEVALREDFWTITEAIIDEVLVGRCPRELARTPTSDGWMPFAFAIKEKQLESLTMLLRMADADMNLDQPGPDGNPPLVNAMAEERLVVKFLSLARKHRHSVDTNCTDKDGVYVLHDACRKGYKLAVRALLDVPCWFATNACVTSGASVGGFPAIHIALDAGEVVSVALLRGILEASELREFDFDVAHPTTGETPLVRALHARHTDFVEALLSPPAAFLERGGQWKLNPNAADSRGCNALHVSLASAKAASDLECTLAFLGAIVANDTLKAAFDPNCLDENKMPALHRVVLDNQGDVLSLLLEFDTLDIDQVCQWKGAEWSALQLAMTLDEPRCTDMILTHALQFADAEGNSVVNCNRKFPDNGDTILARATTREWTGLVQLLADPHFAAT